MFDSVLTKALFIKPKKLNDPWLHKRGFLVSYDFNSAFNNIDFQKNKNSWNKVSCDDFYKHIDSTRLKKEAQNLLYIIESSSNNYIEFMCSIGGVFIAIYLFMLSPSVWNDPSIENVRTFIILMVLLITLVFMYFKKKNLDISNINTYISIEKALYTKE